MTLGPCIVGLIRIEALGMNRYLQGVMLWDQLPHDMKEATNLNHFMNLIAPVLCASYVTLEIE